MQQLLHVSGAGTSEKSQLALKCVPRDDGQLASLGDYWLARPVHASSIEKIFSCQHVLDFEKRARTSRHAWACRLGVPPASCVRCSFSSSEALCQHKVVLVP